MEKEPLFEAFRQRLQAHDSEGAKVELAKLLRADPTNVTAWELLASLLDDPIQQADCYRRILRLDPTHRRAAAKLRALVERIATRERPPRPEEAPPSAASNLSQPESGQLVPQIDELRQLWLEKGFGPLEEDTLRQLRELWLLIAAGGEAAIAYASRFEDIGFLLDLLRLLDVKVPEGLNEVARQQRASRERGARRRPQFFSPREIVELAGEPLPPEKRRPCPKCQAVVSTEEKRCPWCREPLSGREEP